MMSTATSLPGATWSLAPARHFVVGAARRSGAPPDRSDDLALVVSELVTNAIEAAPGRYFDLAVTVTDALATIRVRNRSDDGAPVTPFATFGSLRPRGRGCGIVDALTSSFEVGEDTDGWVVAEAEVPLD